MPPILRTITLAAFLWVAVPTTLAILAGAVFLIIALEAPAWSWIVLIGAAAFELATIVGFHRLLRRAPELPESLSLPLSLEPTLPAESDDRVAT